MTESDVRTTRPALDVLDKDQDRLLYEGDQRRDPPIRPLSDGFGTYYELLNWYQAAAVRTLGHVNEVIEPRTLTPESELPRYLFRWGHSEGPYVRQRLVERLDDVCDVAYRQLREYAQERAGSDNEGHDGPNYQMIDPEEESNPAMRPAFTKLDQEQAAIFERLWTGFEDREELSRWARQTTAAVNGETPDGLLDEIVRSRPLLRDMLNTDSRTATLTRYRFGAVVVLPCCLRAARHLQGGEQSETGGDGVTFRGG